jgi:branched-subunit amino acid aminotransferase/4-amino-4-deoxychorismate lyase
LLHGGKPHTPTPHYLLDGITRRAVIGLASGRSSRTELAKTEEAFITGAAPR